MLVNRGMGGKVESRDQKDFKQDLADDRAVFFADEKKSLAESKKSEPTSSVASLTSEFKVEESESDFEDAESKSKISPQKFIAITHDDLQEGDIPLFLPSSKGMNCAQTMICCLQALTKRPHGHYEITHAAIFVGYKEKDGKRIPQIADVTAKGFRIGELKKDQPILVFRPKNPEVGRLIAEEARRISQIPNKPYWDCCTALGMVFKRKQLNPERELKTKDKEISQATVCSKFDIQIIKKALRRYADEATRRPYYLNIEANSTVKDLEAELCKNPNYDMHISFGKNNLKGSPYEIIQAEIQQHLKRLKAKADRTHDPKVLKKYNQSKVSFNVAIETLDQSVGFDEIEKAIYLAERMEAEFGYNTGWGIRNTSASALKTSMRNLNLFQSVVDKYKDMQAHGFVHQRKKSDEVEDVGFDYIRLEDMERKQPASR